MELQIKAHKIYDGRFDNWNSEVKNKWVYDDFVVDPHYAKEWISVTCSAYHADSDSVYIGIGSFSKELLWKLDRKTGKIESVGYEKVGDRYDGKFHHSIEIDGDDLYAGPALFHDIDKQFVAKGGRVVHYNIKTGEFEFLGLPCERIYIQSLTMDRKRRMLYGFGASPEVFWKFDIDKREGGMVAYIGSGAEFAESHNPVIDDRGRVWGTYGILRAFAFETGPDSVRLFCYDPDQDKMEFLPLSLPREGCDEKSIPDVAINGGDGYLYFGTTQGQLVRFDPEKRETKSLYLNKTGRRLAGLARNPADGLLYGITGEDYDVKLFCYDTAQEALLWERPFQTPEGDGPVRIHHMIFTPDGVLYAGENDNHDRSCYLWECSMR